MSHRIVIATTYILLVAIIETAFGGNPVGPSATRLKSQGAGDMAPGENREAAKSDISFTLDLNTFFEPGMALSAQRLYVIEFEELPLPAYLSKHTALEADGGRFYDSQSSAGKIGSRRFDLKGAKALQYLEYLTRMQAAYLQQIAAKLGQREVQFNYRYALNGIAMKMTPAEAISVARLPGIKHVERERSFELSTDRGPIFIGAPDIWEGTASDGLKAQGEGMVIGIIDTGVNGPNPTKSHTGHPSFAQVGGDGYIHINPYPHFLGECVDQPELCNDKLVGRYSFVRDDRTQPGDPSSQDTDGHGSHVMATAGGNVLLKVPIADAEGGSSGYILERLSGVAPHANLIAYKVCVLGNCWFSAILAALDQAIQDQVDVLNYSISGEGANPWFGAIPRAFLNARAAGIFTATAAGNGGPLPHSAGEDKNSPWNLVVAAQTHDRSFSAKTLENLSGGDSTPPAGISGRSVTGAHTGTIVYAGNFPTRNRSANDEEPEQCLDRFPPGTWTSGEIVVCDRGTVPRTVKGQNVRDGGAGGLVLANLVPDTLDDDRHVLPAIHISHTDRRRLLAWLSSGSNHMATISATGPVITDPAAGDILAEFSARGPAGPDLLVPHVSAPGVAIMAAGADLQFLPPGLGSGFYEPAVRTEFGIISGTSMASPHAAGAAALLKQVRPEWTDAEVHSALMTTANPFVRKEDGVTPADPHDVGAGGIRVGPAARAALLLDESVAAFLAADPDQGGKPSELNLAGLFDRCLTSCTWQRKLTATIAGTWEITMDGEAFSVEPARFTLRGGESVIVSVTSDVRKLDRHSYTFGRVLLAPGDNRLPAQSLPVAAQVAAPLIPESVNILAFSESGSYDINNLSTIQITDFHGHAIGLDRAQQFALALPQDSDSSSPFDDLTDGVSATLIEVSEGATRFVAEIVRAQALDMNLFVGIDLNGDAVPSEDELICVAPSDVAWEGCDVGIPDGFLPSNWWVLAQNVDSFYWQPDVADPFTLVVTVVADRDSGNLRVDGPPGRVEELAPYNVKLLWNDDISVGDIFYGSVFLGSDPSAPMDIGSFSVRLECPQSNDTPRIGGACGNRWPYIASDPVTTASIGSTYRYAVAAFDSDSDDTLTISAEVLPGWLTLTATGAGEASLYGTPRHGNLGENVVSLRVTDSAGDSNVQQFSITVADVTPPVVSLLGPAMMSVVAGSPFEDPGATAWDDVDGDLTSRITITGGVDVARVGAYAIFYDVVDSAGNSAEQVWREVTVTKAPGGNGTDPSVGGGGGAVGAEWLLLTLLLQGSWLLRIYIYCLRRCRLI